MEGSKGTIVCDKCYAFLGAEFTASANYVTGQSFDIDANLGGGAGYRIDLKVNNPKVSGSSKIEISPGGSDFDSIMIFQGFWIKFKADKMTATVTGTGSATGSLTATSGFDATLGAIFRGGSTAWSITSNPSPWKPPSATKPSLAYTQFKLTDFGIRVDLSCAFLVGVTTGVGVTLNADFLFELNPWVAYSMTGKSKFSVVLGNAPTTSTTTATATASRALLQSEAVDTNAVHLRRRSPNGAPPPRAHVYKVGDRIPIQIPYQGLAPKERITVFYSMRPRGTQSPQLQQQQQQTFPIFTKDFIVSSTGEGVFITEYIIPAWDIFYQRDAAALSALQWGIQVHMSHMMSHIEESVASFIVSSPASIFTSALPIDMNGVLPTDKPFAVSWNPSMFRYFEAQNPTIGSGLDTPSTSVSLTLFASSKSDKLDDFTRFLVLKTVPNTQGSTTLTIPRNASALGRRFILMLHDSQHGYVYGTNAGTFALNATTVSSSSSTPATNTVVSSPPLVPTNANGITQETTIDSTSSSSSSSQQQQQPRRLDACTGATPCTLTIGVGAAATFQGISAGTWIWPAPNIQSIPIGAGGRFVIDQVLPNAQFCMPGPSA